MRNCGVLIYCLLLPTVISTHGYNDKTAELMTSGGQIQRARLRPFYGTPVKLRTRPDLPRIIFLKHLLELECLKENYGQNRFKNPAEKPQPPQFILLTPHGNIVKNESNFKSILPAPPAEQPPLNTTTETYHTEKSTIKETTPPSTTKTTTEVDDVVRDFIAYPQIFPGAENDRAEDVMKDSPIIPVEDYDYPSMVSFGDANKIAKISPQPTTSSYHLWHFTRPHRVQPYEVEEIIEEDVRVDVEDDKDESSKDVGFRGGKFFQEGVSTGGEEKQKPGLIDNSISTILKGLINPMVRIMPEVEKSAQTKVIPVDNWSDQIADSRLKLTYPNREPIKFHTTDKIMGKTYNHIPSTTKYDTPVHETSHNPHQDTIFQQDTYRTVHPTSIKEAQLVTETQDEPSPTTQKLANTVKYITESSGSDKNAMDETTFDMVETTKPDTWKNSRKMHFDPHVGISNAISETEQRRSDILIELEDQNQLTAVNYLEKLKQNATHLPYLISTNSDLVIPLIPMVINDLREGRISPEDSSMLSEVFGKYWPHIQAMSDDTNLDMLPLLKMKDVKDLESVFQGVVVEDPGTTTTARPNQNDYNHPYDYMDEYKDLYQDILDQEETRSILRPKRNEKDDLKRLEAMREYFESIAEEENDEGNDYVYEDFFYDDASEDDDSSILELMELADLRHNIRNLTSDLNKNKILF